jgi:hypothetical protein
MGGPQYALSLKQPWAALVVHGLKTLEIRRWATAYRGPLLIHASRQWDERATGWEELAPEVQATIRLQGGIIGQVELVECKAYGSLDAFAADQAQHWNAPEWFLPPVLFGFRLISARLLPFRRYKGQVRLFRVAKEAEEAS